MVIISKKNVWISKSAFQKCLLVALFSPTILDII